MIYSAPLGWVPYCSYSNAHPAMGERKEHFDDFSPNILPFREDLPLSTYSDRRQGSRWLPILRLQRRWPKGPTVGGLDILLMRLCV